MRPTSLIIDTEAHVSKALTKKQLAELLGMSLRTLQRKLKDNNLEVPRGLISPKMKAEILQSLGWGK